MATWNKKYKEYSPDELVSWLDKMKIVDKKGKISFKGPQYIDYAVVLNSMVSINPKIPNIEKKRIIREAAFKAAKKGRISANQLLGIIGKLESEYLKRPPKKYKLVTSISINRTTKIKIHRIDGCTISFKPYLPVKFAKELSKMEESAKRSIVGKFPTNYTFVIVSVAARSDAEAAENGLFALNFLRGIWNLFKNKMYGTRTSFGGIRKPVNNYILGPLHTLHQPNGDLATNTWWYDPEYVSQINPHDPKRELEKLYKFTDQVRGLLKKNNYSEDIISAIVRYTRALDLNNWEDAFLRLWSVLEHLTGTGPRDNYYVTIRRASFLFGGGRYSKLVLAHLKDYRNRAVHEGSDNHDIEAFLYQLKRFVEALILFHLGNSFGFKNITEASSVLDLPCDKAILAKKNKALNYARKFLGFV